MKEERLSSFLIRKCAPVSLACWLACFWPLRARGTRRRTRVSEPPIGGAVGSACKQRFLKLCDCSAQLMR